MKSFLFVPLTLAMALAGTARAAEDPDWSFTLDGSLSRESYPAGTLTTATALLNPSVALGNLEIYVEAPYYGKEADISGTFNIYGPRGRLLASRTLNVQKNFEGAGDIVVGLDYALPIRLDNLLVLGGANYKFDNGDPAELTGSGSRDATLTLDGRYRMGRFDFKAGVGHTWTDPTGGTGSSDQYTYWSVGLTARPSDRVSLGVNWSDQQAISGVKTNQSAIKLSADFAVTEQMTLYAGYRIYEDTGKAGQPENESSIGVSWSL